MLLAGILLGQGVRILIDSGASHNVIDINFSRLIKMMECWIHTMVLVGNGTKITCSSASFNVPLHIDTETFHIDTLLVDIGNDIDVILGTPWLANIGIITWNFTSLEMQFQRNGHTVNLSSLQDHYLDQHVLALPAPALIQPLPAQGGQQLQPLPQPHYNLLQATMPR